MKILRLLAFAVVSGALSLNSTGCTKKKGPAERIGSKVDDALDQRPGEKVRDAVEKAVE